MPEKRRNSESIKTFNEFQAQTRTRIETTVKFVLLISGSMLTLSVGAVISGKASGIDQSLIPSLVFAWSALFYSIAAGLTLMVLLVISTYHMGLQWAKQLQVEIDEVKTIKAWPWLEVVNWILGISGAVSCLVGLFGIANFAIGVASK